MALRIASNQASAYALTRFANTNQALTGSLERLSSGQRINRAADDAAGMTISHSLASQARALGQAARNVNDAVSVTQVADSGLGQAVDLLQTIRTKAVQAAQDGQSPDSRQALQADVNRAVASLADLSRTTSYNNQNLLSGSFSNKSFQVGTNPGETVTVSIASIAPGDLGLKNIDLLSQEGAQAAIKTVDTALEQVNANRSGLGASQNQLGASLNNLATTQQNVAASASAISDLDLAKEAMNFSRLKALTQAQSFAMAQSGKVDKQSVFNLLQG